jgi:plasmid stabilization system protein ParE
MRRLVIDPAARRDIAAAFDCYESARQSLGTKFINDVDFGLARIVRSPLQFRIISQSIRCALMRRFPYGRYFVAGDEDIVVIACLHGSRSPSVWKGRA